MMKKNSINLHLSQLSTRLIFACLVVFSLTAAALLGTSVLTPRQSAQEKMTGEWLADFSRKNPNEVQFTTIHRTERGGMNNSGDGILLSELQGLTREQAFGAKTEVSFRIVREAGTFVCEGYFKEGRGAGFWTLTPNPAFVAAMRERGYANLSDKDLYHSARFDISVKSVDDLKAAGFEKLSFNDLFEASIFKVTSAYIGEMKAAGFENLTLKQLVEARIFKIDAEYVKEVQAMGFERQPLKMLVEMRIAKITPEFIRQMRGLGFENLSLRELNELGIHGVTPEFVESIKAEGFSVVSARQAVELKIHGVDRDFIRRVRAKGFNDVTLRQLVDLRINNIVK
jgi:hypothetical protein